MPPTVIVKLVANAAAAALEIETVAAPPCESPLDAGLADVLALLEAAAGAFVVDDVFAVNDADAAFVVDDVFAAEAAVGAFAVDGVFTAGAAAAALVCVPVERPPPTAGLKTVAAVLTDGMP